MEGRGEEEEEEREREERERNIDVRNTHGLFASSPDWTRESNLTLGSMANALTTEIRPSDRAAPGRAQNCRLRSASGGLSLTGPGPQSGLASLLTLTDTHTLSQPREEVTAKEACG